MTLVIVGFCVCVGGGGGGGRERGKIADTMNIETASAIFYCRFD